MTIFNFNEFKKVFPVIAFSVFLLGSHTTMAQQPAASPQDKPEKDLSEEDLKTFASASKSIREVQLKFQEEMIATMEDEGIAPETFNSLMRAQQSGNQADVEYTEEEKAAFTRVRDKLMTRQEELNDRVEEALQEHNLTTEEYEEMATAIKKSPEAQQKVVEMMTPEK